MKTPILYCKRIARENFKDSLVVPKDNDGNELAFRHFSGGSIAITSDLIGDLIYVASLHGWSVTVEEPKP